MTDGALAERIEAVRRFSRFYTKRIGALHEGLLNMPFSLAEARLIYEVAHHETTTATELGRELGLDAGYLSRLLKGLEARGMIEKSPSEADARQNLLSLTEAARTCFAEMNGRSRAEVGLMLERLSEAEQRRLVEALGLAERLLGDPPARRVPYILRPHQIGDMGWVVQAHGVAYAQEYRWDETFEALVAEIVAGFVQHYRPARERCWIAERAGAIVGSVFLVEEGAETAKLRLLLVEPAARGLGIGTRLVAECASFARQAGYRRIRLWTNSALHAARHIYAKAGYRLVREEPHHSFGHDLVGETWELALQ
jgi:DNA-binding MarR family transcriptional regulator/GNAT superfamily N-acetyltransferase